MTKEKKKTKSESSKKAAPKSAPAPVAQSKEWLAIRLALKKFDRPKVDELVRKTLLPFAANHGTIPGWRGKAFEEIRNQLKENFGLLGENISSEHFYYMAPNPAPKANEENIKYIADQVAANAVRLLRFTQICDKFPMAVVKKSALQFESAIREIVDYTIEIDWDVRHMEEGWDHTVAHYIGLYLESLGIPDAAEDIQAIAASHADDFAEDPSDFIDDVVSQCVAPKK